MKVNLVKVLALIGILSTPVYVILAFLIGRVPMDALIYLTSLFGLCALIGLSSSIIFAWLGHYLGKYISACCCDLGWHKPIDIKNVEGDPLKLLKSAECKYCHMKGILDGQGNLF